jgi:hypothetical protein
VGPCQCIILTLQPPVSPFRIIFNIISH